MDDENSVVSDNGSVQDDEELPFDPNAADGERPSIKFPRNCKQRPIAVASSRTRTPSKKAIAHSCIVKLIVQRVNPNYAEPWRCKNQSAGAGTGFLVSGRRIVTNAHVVRNCTHVRARKSLSPVMYSCTVEWVAVRLDLAILSVNDEDAFFGSESRESSLPGGKDVDHVAVAAADATLDKPAASTNKKGGPVDNAATSGQGLPLCSDLPQLDENVTCAGFPRGGQQISVTRGVVSRVDLNSLGVLRIQIDAAINPGNSGGPVFDEQGRVIGVASSHLRGGSNIGYIIPTEVLLHFIRMTEDGLEANPIERSALNCERRKGELEKSSSSINQESESTNHEIVGIVGPRTVPSVSSLGLCTQTLESKALRKKLGLKKASDGGVRVSGTSWPSPFLDADGPDGPGDVRLLIDDVLLTIDGVEVGQDGTIPLSADRPYERIGKSYLITRHRVGHQVELGIIRDGRHMTLPATLRPNRYICPVHDSFDAHPSYVVCGGCVFVPLSSPWVLTHKHGFPGFNSISSNPAKRDEQIIVLSKVLADEVNVGYHHKRFLTLRSINGKEPTNMRDVIRYILEAARKEEYLEFRCCALNQDSPGTLICLNVEDCKAGEERILKQHMIAQWCSDDIFPPELKEQFKGEATKAMCSLLSKEFS